MNQCMGCQAGWPRRWLGHRIRSKAIGRHIHEVVGGYRGEIVSCQRDKYDGDQESSSGSERSVPADQVSDLAVHTERPRVQPKMSGERPSGTPISEGNE